MNRNQNSHFSLNPQADIKRSRFRRNQSVKLSFNAGQLIPFYVDEVLPGDTMSIDTSKLVRMQTLITPCMDNIYLDTYYFFVPNRLVWEHWKNFMGENTTAPWYPDVEYTVPQVLIPADALPPDSAGRDGKGWKVGTIADYMGIPSIWGEVADISVSFSVSALPFRAYALIWNEWFRDQNLQTPQNIPLDDNNIQGTNADSGLNQAITGGFPLPVGKYRDYFTSCLSAPQKGPDVLLPLGQFAPVDSYTNGVFPSSNQDVGPTTLEPISGDSFTNGNCYQIYAQGAPSGAGVINSGAFASTVPDSEELHFSNLYADLSNATAATINQLRLAFQIQKIYEADARGGTRYIEVIANHFGVTSPDSRMQRPEYLGGNRMLINVNQVVQNSESSTTPQGTTTAYSLTVDNHSDFTHSFVEHGFLIGVMCARYDHTYQQGIERFWSRKSRFDYYWPKLANIGEQPVYNREIYVQGTSSDDEVFGYQEAWADYRYKPNRVSGEMRSYADASLDV